MGIINNTLGRGIIMLVVSLLFLEDKLLFHKLTAIFLFIGGTPSNIRTYGPVRQ